MADNQQQSQKPPKKYGKRSVWFWILVYLIIAGVVYGLIYLLFMNNGNNGGGLY